MGETNGGSIINVTVNGTVSGNGFAGLLIGVNVRSYVTNSSTTGSVSAVWGACYSSEDITTIRLPTPIQRRVSWETGSADLSGKSPTVMLLTPTSLGASRGPQMSVGSSDTITEARSPPPTGTPNPPVKPPALVAAPARPRL